MVCTTRQLTQAERDAAAADQRNSGVVRAVRPFSGSPTLENLIDYIQRELTPCVQASRTKVNDVYKQVADNAPSANPLVYYFSTTTANADPTVGRVRLDAATQNTATTFRVSQTNGRLEDVTAWLDIMSGGATTPLGVVTILDTVNPGRFLRGDLLSMTDQGAYWNLAVNLVEASDTNPFVDGEGVIISFISGVASTGATVAVGSLSPVARDTFLGNITNGTTAPSANLLASVASTSLAYDGTSHTFQRPALTGDVTAALNSNALTIAAGSITNAKLANMNPGTVKGLQINAGAAAPPVDLTGAEVGQLLRRAFLSDQVGVAGANDDFALDARVSIIRVNPGLLGGDVTFTGFALNGGGAAANAGGFFVLVKQGAANVITLANENAGSSTANRLELAGDLVLSQTNLCVIIHYWGGRWQVIGAPFLFAGTGIAISAGGIVTVDQTFAPVWTGNHTFSRVVALNERVRFGGVISPAAISSDQNNYAPSGWATANTVRLSTDATTRTLTGASAGSSGELKWLINLGPFSVNLSHENASSTAANRWLLVSGTNFGINVNGVVGILYDGTSSRWRPVSNL